MNHHVQVWMFLSDHVRKLMGEFRNYDEAREYMFYAKVHGENRVMYVQYPEV